MQFLNHTFLIQAHSCAPEIILLYNLQSMRVIFTFLILIVTTVSKAQTSMPSNVTGFPPYSAFHSYNSIGDTTSRSKWFISKYGAFSTSFVFYKGGHATVFSAPAGLQLNRRLNNNLYAFTGISVAPAYITNNTFLSTDINKANPNNRFWQPGKLGMYARAEAGLMYVNDAKTFSISGSIGIERSSYPAFPYYPVNNANAKPAVYSGR